jgi:hypothetical protein
VPLTGSSSLRGKPLPDDGTSLQTRAFSSRPKQVGSGGSGDAADEGCRPFMRLAVFRS